VLLVGTLVIVTGDKELLRLIRGYETKSNESMNSGEH
jgi:hypothetical protein